MVLRVPDAVFAQSVRLVGRGTIDAGPSGLTAGMVGVDVIHDHFEPSVRLRGAPGRRHLVFLGYRMQPNSGISHPDLPMDRSAVIGPMQAARGEAERLDQEVMRGLDVLVDKDRDDRGLDAGAPLSRHAVKLQS